MSFYLVIAAVAIFVAIFIGKHILFNPILNNIITIAAVVVGYVFFGRYMPSSVFGYLLIVINLLDCIHDFTLYGKYYSYMDVELDKTYVLKSLSVVLLLAPGILSAMRIFPFNFSIIFALLPRAIFLLIIYPLEARTIKQDVNTMLNAGLPIPCDAKCYSKSSNFGRSKKEAYHYQKYVESLCGNGEIVSNYDMIEAEGNLKNDFIHAAYVSSDTYYKYSQVIGSLVSSKIVPFYSCILKDCYELRELHFEACNGTKNKDEEKWGNYFIAKVLNKFVEENVDTMIKKGKVIPYQWYGYSDSIVVGRHYQQYAEKLEDDGILISNFDTICDENLIDTEKFNKIVDKSPENVDLEALEDEIDDVFDHAAYLPVKVYEKYPEKIVKVLKERGGNYSPHTIRKFPELKDFHFEEQNGIEPKDEERWADYFIIMALDGFVKKNEISEFNYSDEPFNNHSYGLGQRVSRTLNDIFDDDEF